jgi:hypothetical protein
MSICVINTHNYLLLVKANNATNIAVNLSINIKVNHKTE